MTEHTNLVLFMADTVRRDYFPNFEEGTTVKALAPGPNTPQSFTSIMTGVVPAKHEVTWFNQTTKRPTVLNLDQMGFDTGYWDHPDSPMYRVFNHRSRKKFEEMNTEENFVWVKRETVSHLPYGMTWEEGNLGEESEQRKRSKEYADLFHIYNAVEDPDSELTQDEVLDKGEEFLREGEDFSEWQKEQIKNGFNYITDYIEGVQKSKENFLEIVEKAKEKGVYEDTLFVYCTDHGDCLPIDGRNAVAHRLPTGSVTDVKAHFHNASKEDLEEFLTFQELRIEEILKVWNPNWKAIRPGLEVKDSRRTSEAEREMDEKAKERLKEMGYV